MREIKNPINSMFIGFCCFLVCFDFVFAERKGLTPSSQYLVIIDFTAPLIARVTYRVTELFYFDFNELCSTNIVII